MTGFVYAIGDSERVKIGWSRDPIRRLAKVKTDCSTDAQLFGLVPATQAQEAEAHKLLTHWRIQGEWFRHEGAVAAFVAMLPRPKPRPVRKTRAGKASEVIDALGGTTAIARLTNRTPQAVTNWRARGKMPAGTFLIMTAALQREKKTAPLSLWGMVEAAE